MKDAAAVKKLEDVADTLDVLKFMDAWKGVKIQQATKICSLVTRIEDAMFVIRHDIVGEERRHA